MSFEEVKQLAQQGRHEEAFKLSGKSLNKNPNDPALLYMAGRMLIEMGFPAVAKPICLASAEVSPTAWESWNLLGKAQADIWETEEARECFRRALQLSASKEPSPLSNMSQADILLGRPEKAIDLCKKALQIDPNDFNAQHNMGMALLMLRRWKEGWFYYEFGLGQHETRRELIYGNEPRWDGSKGKTVVAYGEQGIGDEILFASAIPDLIRDSKKVVIDCDNRLEGLFKRSFPDADVYGTRFRVSEWPDRYTFDGRVAGSSLQKFYRQADADFPGKPYLVADPERRKQWRAVLDDLPGLKIGIAWTGGIPFTGQQFRSLTLEDMLPVLKQKASFVSLEYRDPTQEIEAFNKTHHIKIHEWGRATRTLDYDDTAALVAELDLVISVTTATIHLCGALGKECWVMVHKHPMYRYGLEGDLPWYKSVHLYRQKTDWTYVVNRIAEDLSARIQSLLVSPKKAITGTAKRSSKHSKRSGRRR